MTVSDGELVPAAGWWFWADACTSAAQTVPFVQYLPGITVRVGRFTLLKRMREGRFHGQVWCTGDNNGPGLCFQATIALIMINCIRR